MRSSSADGAPARGPGRAYGGEPRMGRWGRLAVGAALLAVAVGAPLLGLSIARASAQFDSTDTVTITISVAPSVPAEPAASPSASTPAP
jgi:hypothetical protein